MKFSTLTALLLVPAGALAQSSSAVSESASSSVASAATSAASAAASASGNSTSAGASSAYLTQVLAALTAANLTSLVSVATSIASTSEGAALLAGLAVGNKTVFAPNNAAFDSVSSDVSSNTTLLTQILSYHILNRTYTPAGVAVSPSHTIARTLLKGGNYSLPGNFSAPLVLTKTSNSTNSTGFSIVQATSNATATGPAVAANLNVYIIDQVLSLPPSLSAAATSLVPSLAGVISSAGLLEPLEQSQGVTIFAPNDAAISAVTSALGSLNATQISTILANHVINGTVVYSTGLASSNYTSAAGEAFTITKNATGSFVSSGGSSAQIVQSDIIVGNGVIHLINNVLVNTGSNSTAAAAAYSSGVAAAATSTEATAGVTATSTAATGTGAGASGSASATKSASGRLAPMGFTNSMVGGLVALVGAVVGGGFLLL